MIETIAYFTAGFGIAAAWDALRRFAARNAVDPAELEDLRDRLDLVEARPDLLGRVQALEEASRAHGKALTKDALARSVR